MVEQLIAEKCTLPAKQVKRVLRQETLLIALGALSKNSTKSSNTSQPWPRRIFSKRLTSCLMHVFSRLLNVRTLNSIFWCGMVFSWVLVVA